MEDRGRTGGGQVLTDLSKSMVGLHREHYGRGPGASKAMLVDDLVVCVMSDVYTRAEGLWWIPWKTDRRN